MNTSPVTRQILSRLFIYSLAPRTWDLFRRHRLERG